MRLSIAVLVLLTIGVSAYGQGDGSIVRKGKKWGLKEGEEWVLKPRYDSIVQADSLILIAYRKKRICYLTQEGLEIYEDRRLASGPFMEGMGVVQDRDSMFMILNRKGECISRPSLLMAPPARFGKFVFLKKHDPAIRYANQCLYRADGLVQEYIKSLSPSEGFLISNMSVLRTNRRSDLMAVFQPETGEVLERDINKMVDVMGHLLLRKVDGHTTLYEKRSKQWIRGLDDVEVLDSTYFISKKGREQSLYLWKDHRFLLRAACERIEFRPDYIYAVVREDSLQPKVVSVFDYTGRMVKDSLMIRLALEDGRYLLEHKGMQYIGKENGDALSGYYERISPIAVNGYRIVSNATTYSYINDRTYQKLPVELGIVYQRSESRSSGSSGGGFFESLVKIIALPAVVVAGAVLALPTGGKSIKMIGDFLGSSSSSSSISTGPSYSVLIPGPEQVFVEGMAIYSHYQANPGGMNSNIPAMESLTYNYIDTTGATLNAKKYRGCFPFQGGKAWVREAEHWLQIDKRGKNVGTEKFESIKRYENGFTEVWNSYTTRQLIFFSHTYHECVLFDPQNKRVHKGTFSSIALEGNAYYGYRGETKIKLAEVKPQ